MLLTDFLERIDFNRELLMGLIPQNYIIYEKSFDPQIYFRYIVESNSWNSPMKLKGVDVNITLDFYEVVDQLFHKIDRLPKFTVKTVDSETIESISKKMQRRVNYLRRDLHYNQVSNDAWFGYDSELLRAKSGHRLSNKHLDIVQNLPFVVFANANKIEGKNVSRNLNTKAFGIFFHPYFEKYGFRLNVQPRTK